MGYRGTRSCLELLPDWVLLRLHCGQSIKVLFPRAHCNELHYAENQECFSDREKLGGLESSLSQWHG